ncbi:hypothetical protein [Aquimarina rubra]|uniref:DUF2937 family protein n=1 Tax=Aquimarina rubra TaxID=1920033 RepID=A0ABW5LG76_9FLAO
MKSIISIILIAVSLVIFGLRISKKIQFKQNVSGYLKRAADANTIELANDELTKVIDYLESNNITNGYTSILWETPDEDISFWYKNLKASQTELQNLKSNSALERTNVLIKLRETLVDTGERTRVTVPKGLAVYPNNTLWSILMWMAFLSISTGFVILAIESDKRSKKKKEQQLSSS